MCSRNRGRTSAAVGLYGALKPALLQWEVWERMYFEMKKAGECPAFFLLPRRGSGVGHFKFKHLVEEGEQVNVFVHTQVALVFSQPFYFSFQKVYMIRQLGACQTPFRHYPV